MNSEIDSDIKKSSIKFEKLDSNKTKMIYDFYGDSLNLKINSIYDESKKSTKRYGTLTIGKEKFYEFNITLKGSTALAHYDFGSAVNGIKELSLVGEKTPRGSYITGAFDGKEIIPIHTTMDSCDCSSKKQKSILSVGEDLKVSIGEFELANPKAQEQFKTLAKVMETKIANFKLSKEYVDIVNEIEGYGDGCILICTLIGMTCMAGIMNPLCIIGTLVCYMACNESSDGGFL